MEGCVMGITIKDVAAAAGTSVSTVSKVINGHYSISEETAARVRRVMQELNYYPNASAQSFARGTTKTIAVLASQGSDLSAKCRRTGHPRFRNSIPLVRTAYKIALSSHRVGRAEF